MFSGLKFFATGRDDDLKLALNLIEENGGKVISFLENSRDVKRLIHAILVGSIGCNATKIAYAVEKGIPLIRSSWPAACLNEGFLLTFREHEYGSQISSPFTLQKSFGESPCNLDAFLSPRRSYASPEKISPHYMAKTEMRPRVHHMLHTTLSSRKNKEVTRSPDVYVGTDWVSSLRQGSRPTPIKSKSKLKGTHESERYSRIFPPNSIDTESQRKLFSTPNKPCLRDSRSGAPSDSIFEYSNVVPCREARKPQLSSMQASATRSPGYENQILPDYSFPKAPKNENCAQFTANSLYIDDEEALRDTTDKLSQVNLRSDVRQSREESYAKSRMYKDGNKDRRTRDNTEDRISRRAHETKRPMKENISLYELVKNHPDGIHIDKELIEQILQQIVQFNAPNSSSKVSFKDISGLENCKQAIAEAIILPCHRPELFTGLRRPSSAILLFGPPGNGKTMLAQAIACECKTTFFSLAASSLISKFVGDSEKAIKALFTIAHILAPSILFFDEIDSLLQARGGSTEMEGSRRLKTEFLIQVDGVKSKLSEVAHPQPRVMVIGATNRPFDLDDAVLRRFAKKIFVPLPAHETRLKIMKGLFASRGSASGSPQGSSVKISLSEREWGELADLTDGYSSSDLSNLCKEIALIPIRELDLQEAMRIGESDLREINFADAKKCLQLIKPSSSRALLEKLEEWNSDFGST